jgi:hypothetical protein
MLDWTRLDKRLTEYLLITDMMVMLGVISHTNMLDRGFSDGARTELRVYRTATDVNAYPLRSGTKKSRFFGQAERRERYRERD